VASTLGQGSTFTVYLPGGPTVASPVPTPPLPGAVAARVVPEIEGAKILVVDDDFRNIFAMTALLERSHATVTVAESGPDALAILERTPDIDIVLMDIMMPIMDGYATIRAIRALDRFRTLPIVAVTGKVMPGERQRCLDAGANDFVPKPVDTAELVAVLRPWLPLNTVPTP
jgi:CheY-like chemotaxis protein